jgi:hypothetical protein
MKPPKLGKLGAVKSIAKKLTEVRKWPISKEVFEIVEENSKRNESRKKVAEPRGDLEI